MDLIGSIGQQDQRRRHEGTYAIDCDPAAGIMARAIETII
jgi:hypothetical protein